MGATYTYPNGQVFNTTALTLAQLNTLFQSLFSNMFGLTNASPNWNSFVRIGWQTEGAPAWTVTDNFLSFNVSEENDEYNKIRDYNRGSNGTTLLDTYVYTRVWRIRLTAYGPNSTDNARQVRSTLLFPWAHDILAGSNLYLQPKLNSPVRVPELYQGRWWEVVSFQFLVNEQVTETLTVNAVESVEVISNASNSGQISDIIISA